METIFDKIPEYKKQDNKISAHEERILNKVIKILENNNSDNLVYISENEYKTLKSNFWDVLKQKLEKKWWTMNIDYRTETRWWFRSWWYIDQRENWREPERTIYTYYIKIKALIW